MSLNNKWKERRRQERKAAALEREQSIFKGQLGLDRFTKDTYLNEFLKPKAKARSWKEDIRSTLAEYRRKAEVKASLSIKVRKIKSWARAKMDVDPFSDKVRTAEVIVSHHFKALMKKDPVQAGIFLKWAVAHEVGHVQQREQRGLGYFIGEFPHRIEIDANLRAAEISGIKKEMAIEAQKILFDWTPPKTEAEWKRFVEFKRKAYGV